MPAKRAEPLWRRTCVAAAAALGVLEARDATKSLSSGGGGGSRPTLLETQEGFFISN